jgi:hypothetical protein
MSAEHDVDDAIRMVAIGSKNPRTDQIGNAVPSDICLRNRVRRNRFPQDDIPQDDIP